MPYTFNVGTLSSATHAPLEKLQVAVVDRAGDRTDVFGTGLTDAQGRATIAFDLAQFPNRPPGQLPNIFFRILDGNRLVHSTMAAPLEALAPGTYDFIFEIDLKQTVSEFCIVTGRITDTEGRPVAGTRVRIVDCEMVTDQELGQVHSDAKGAYLHRYSLQQTSPDEIRTADLRISVLDDSGGEIARSAVVRNASEHQVIDLTVPGHLVPGRVSEWHWVLDRTTAVAQGRAAFQWTDENLDFLHPECGIDSKHLRWFRQDAIWSRAHKLEPSFCYALLRMGEPEDWDALLRRTPNSRRAALKSAQAQKIIAVSPAKAVEAFLSRMTRLAVEALSRDPPPDASPALLPIGALLSGTNLPAATQRRIAEFALSLENPSEFLEALDKESAIDEQAKRKTRFVVDSFELLGRHAPTVRALPQGDSVLDLAGLTPQDWLGVVQKIGVDVPDPAAHAETLAAKVELAMPTAVVAHRMLRNPDGDANEVQVGNFLLANPRFDLRMPVDKFLREGADLKGIDDVPVFTRRLKADARRARIAPDRNRYDWIHGLAAMGLDSAADVVALGRAGFMRQAMPIAAAAANTGGAQGGGGRPRPAPPPDGFDPSSVVVLGAVYDAAFATTTATQFTLAKMIDMRTVPAGVMPSLTPHGEETNWTRLFGSLNACLCDECESVHGPAAYLVDLVRFLRSEASGGELPTLYDVVLQRRPDIDTIELNCANAHTPIPYIDLVNEILELAVAPPDPASEVPEWRTRPANQTNGTSDADKAQLRAMPANLWEPAYNALADSRRLFKLPFVLEHEESMLYARLAGIDLVEAMNWLGLANDETALVAATLGLSRPTAALISEPAVSDSKLRDIWGEGGRAELERIQTLTERTGMPPDELRSLITSAWFAPLTLGIDVHDAPCRIEQHTLTVLLDGGKRHRQLSAWELHRTLHLLHRFLRLREALGIPAAALSEALSWQQPLKTNLAEVEKDGDPLDLANVVQMVRLSNRLSRPLGAGSLASDGELRRAMPVSDDDWQPLVDLHHGDPFEAARRRSVLVDLAEVEKLLDERDFMHDAGLDIAELRYLTQDIDLVPAVFAPTQQSLDRWLQGAYDATRRVVPPAGLSPSPPIVADPPSDAERAALDAWEGDLERVRQAAIAFLAGIVALNPETVGHLLADPSPKAPGRTTRALLRLPDDINKPAVEAFVEWVTSTGASPLETHVSRLEPLRRTRASTTLQRLLKVCRLVQLLGLSGADLRSIAALPEGAAADIEFPDFNALPIGRSGARQALVRVRNLWLARRTSNSFASRDVSVFSLIEAAYRESSPTSTAIVVQLEAATGWGNTVVRGDGTDTLARLARQLGVHTAQRLRRPAAYARLHDFVRWTQQRGLTPETANRLSLALQRRPRPPAEEPENLAAVLHDLAHLRYDGDAAWHAALTPAMDRLRSRRRDALVSYLLAYGGLEPRVFWKDADDLYAHFLIDVQMGPCLQSSRIVQAHNTLQLFVQRCLFKIGENGVNLGDTYDNAHWRQWEWMKHYRVWEAARKVFLYPENWIEPELLDEKSPPYRQLETALLQDEIKQDTAERAVRDYVQRLHAVARLEVMSLFEEVIGDEKLVHVVARTAATPQVYFYRWRRADRSWTAWEKIDLSIDAEQVVLVVHNRRPMLFWPTFVEAADQGGKAWNVTLSWCERDQHGWQPPKSYASTEPLDKLELDRLALRADLTESAQGIILDVMRMARVSNAFKNWRIVVNACTGEGRLNPVEVEEMSWLAVPTPLTVRSNRFEHRWGMPTLNVPVPWLPENASGIADTDLMNLLSATEEGFSITPSHQYAQFKAFQPFVYADSERQFFASQTFGLLPATKAGRDVFGLAPQYRFENFYHPYACQMLLALNEAGLDGLFRPGEADLEIVASVSPRRFPRQRVREPDTAFVDAYGAPTSHVWCDEDNAPYIYPVASFDFDHDGAYATYNWEAFFHIPLLIADRLTKNQRFADAQRWLHYIFDPTDVSYHDAPQKYWRVKPLFEEAERWGGPAETLDDMLSRLALDSRDVVEQVQAWMADPFNPHRLARLRPAAYMKTVVFKYLDNLLAWGDSLFARFTMESINEAVQLYVLASRILGPRPVMVTPPPRERVLTVGEVFGTWRDDELGNLLIDLETGLPPVVWPASPAPGGELPPNLALYFCIPPNARLLEYWDTVEDRLFKIRHCQDLQGRSRQLPLFAPPIDPALLVRARAAGMDIDEVLAMALNPIELSHRFTVQLQKAMEVCAEARSLGSALLAALEKKDSEEMALLRARQESALLALIESVKQQQADEATESLAAVRTSRTSAEARKTFYSTNAEQMRNAAEETQLGNLRQAHEAEVVSHGFRLASAIAHLLPQISAGGPEWGGTNLGNALDSAAVGANMIAAQWTFDASMAGIEGSHQRRRDEWLFQADLADKEIAQIDKQVLAAEIRQSIAVKDLSNHRAQIQHAQAMLDLLSHKFTNAELHGWMAGQLSALHHEAYRLAFDLARRAEAAAQFELGLEPNEFTHVQFGHWDSLRKGLLAGERLAMELRRMEIAYMDLNTRDFEITKHISLRQLPGGPEALLRLRAVGECEFAVPEDVFIQDFRDHWFRRIKTVSLSVPCVVGPYGGVPATLTLQSSSILLRSGIPRPRNQRPAQAIATSSGQSDSGMFELNFRDERYLPFEGAGVASAWSLRLPPAGSRAFDYDTISDVILHLRYTARPGADPPPVPSRSGTHAKALLLSLRHDFPKVWGELTRLGDGAVAISALSLSKSLLPLRYRDRRVDTGAVQIWFAHAGDASGDTDQLQATLQGTVDWPTLSPPDSLPDTIAIADIGAASASLTGDTPAAWALFADSASAESRAAWRNLKNCYLLVTYTVT